MRSIHMFMIRLSLAVIIPCVAAHAQEPLRSDWTVRGNIPMEQFVIQSHRGAGEIAPENTLESFALAWELGTVPEADLRTTSDGVIVCFHDNNFDRVVRGAGEELNGKRVKDLAWQELSQLDVGSFRGEQFAGQRVPRVADALKRMKGQPERMLYLDIKEVDLQQLAQEVMQHGVERQVILASTHYPLIRQWKMLVPASQTLLWMGGSEEQLRKRLDDLREADFEAITQLQIHVRLNGKPAAGGGAFEVSDQFLIDVGNELRQRGILFQTLPWRTTDTQVYRRLLDLGVMSFATDFPQVTLDAVRAYYDDGDRR